MFESWQSVCDQTHQEGRLWVSTVRYWLFYLLQDNFDCQTENGNGLINNQPSAFGPQWFLLGVGSSHCRDSVRFYTNVYQYNKWVLDTMASMIWIFIILLMLKRNYLVLIRINYKFINHLLLCYQFYWVLFSKNFSISWDVFPVVYGKNAKEMEEKRREMSP